MGPLFCRPEVGACKSQEHGEPITKQSGVCACACVPVRVCMRVCALECVSVVREGGQGGSLERAWHDTYIHTTHTHTEKKKTA